MTTKQPTTDPQPSLNGHKPAEESKAYDPFDPTALRVGQSDIDVERVLTAVPVRKPKNSEFVRVHPEFQLDTLLLERETGMDREMYLVQPQVQHLVLPELRRTRLHVAITKRGTVFLWPIKLPIEGNDTGRRIFETAAQAAEQAKTLWVKVSWNRDLGGYEMFRAKGDLGNPVWPEKTFRDLVEIAFRHYLIDAEDHPVIRELAGEL